MDRGEGEVETVRACDGDENDDKTGSDDERRCLENGAVIRLGDQKEGRQGKKNDQEPGNPCGTPSGETSGTLILPFLHARCK